MRSAEAAPVSRVKMHTSSLSTPLTYEAFTLDRSAVSGKRTAREGKSVDRSCWWYLRQLERHVSTRFLSLMQ